MKIEIQHQGIVYELDLPETSEELKAHDWLVLYHLRDEEGVTLAELQARFLAYLLSDLPDEVVKIIPTDTIVEIINKMDFFLGTYTARSCPFDSFELEGVKFTAPEDLFASLTGADYAFIEAYKHEYEDSQDEFALYKRAAILYRDHSKDFDEAEVEASAKLLQKHMSIYYEQVLSDWYAAMHKELEEDFEVIFNQGGRASKVESLGFIEIIYSLAGEKLGQVKDVEKESVRSIFTACLLEKNASDRIKEAMNKK